MNFADNWKIAREIEWPLSQATPEQREAYGKAVEGMLDSAGTKLQYYLAKTLAVNGKLPDLALALDQMTGLGK